MRTAEGVLLTGVYGSGKSSLVQEIAYLLEQRGEPYALLDLDYLSWGVPELAAAPTNSGCCCRTWPRWRRTTAGPGSGCSSWPTLSAARRSGRRAGGPGTAAAGGAPGGSAARYRARLAGDVTSGRRDDLRAAAESIAAAEGAGVEDLVISNDRPVGVVARAVLTFLGWPHAS